jgi:3-isopropylmalate/(R)-2-methylmalate dehydratase large subunit
MPTLAEKILARASGRSEVAPDHLVVAGIDLALSHENSDLVRKHFLDLGAPRVWDPEKIVIAFDRRVPAESEKSAAAQKAVREFVAAQGIRSFYDVGRGICHQVAVENGHVRPGMIVVGTDSHTTIHGAFGALATGIGTTEMAGVWCEGTLWFKVPATLRILVEGEFRPWISAKDLILYIVGMLGARGAEDRAVEFDGPVVRRMSVAGRMVLTNLSKEMGARCAFTPVDDRLIEHLRPICGDELEAIAPDGDAGYERRIHIHASEDLREPVVACPHAVDHVKPLSALGEIPVHQAVIGSCASGRLEDLAVAASIVAGRTVHRGTRLIVIPASRQVYRAAIRAGYIETLVAAGAIVGPPGCGPCSGAHSGTLAPGETCVSSANRNFLGRMGSKDSLVYLASPAVAAASAIAGRLTHPLEVARESMLCLAGE